VGCLANLNGEFVARHIVSVTDSIPVLIALEHTINALMAQHDSEILCLSVGVSGVVDENSGIINSSSALDLYDFNLAEKLSKTYHVPVYVGNNTEFATRTQMIYGTKADTENLTTLFVGDTIDIGSAFGSTHYQHGGNISVLPLATTPNKVAFLKRKNIIARIQELIEQNPDSVLANCDKITLLDVRRACLLNDSVGCILQDEMAEVLAQVFAWIITLIRPDELVLAGSISLMGQTLIDITIEKLSTILPSHVISGTRISIAEASRHLELRGAVAHGLNRELGIV
jgi:predicted NBD/HSP70 family sugar kinase